MSWVWRELHSLFDTDDGSLPELIVTYKDVQAVAKGYEILWDASKSIYPEDIVLWSTADDDKSIDLFKISNPAKLVTSYQIHPFHLVISRH